MSSLQLDSDGDLLVTKNNLTFTTGQEAIRQHLQARFRFFSGEWFLDETIGVPYFRDILVKKPVFAVVQQILKDTVLDTHGVTELLSFDFNYDQFTREASLEFKCNSIDGPIDFTQVIEIG
jgi:hypothetical protein